MTDNRINGTRFQDVLGGTAADDLIRGRGGNDVLRGRRGDDDLRGDGGDDRLFGGAGDDRLIAGRGDDVIFGGAGADLMIWNNGDGSDRLRGGGGNDEARIVSNGAGADVFEIASAGRAVALQRTGEGAFALDIRGTETVRLRTGGGDDSVDAGALAAGATRLIVDAGGGDDEVVGSQGDDVVRGGGGNDLVIGGRGDDDLFGGAGDDVFVWNNGDGSDLMRGGRGLDTVMVNGAEDAGNLFAVTEGEAGVLFDRTNLGPFQLDIRDVETLRVNGGEEADVIDAGGLSADALALELFGRGGDDRIIGGDGDDLLDGGDGDDLLIGSRGDDRMIGGEGDDVLVWNNGDGSDLMQGDGGDDRAVVNGADGAGDEFTVADGENGVLFNRLNLGLFELDIREVETLEVNGGGGDDSFDATALSAGLIDVVFNGGAGDDVFLGGDGDDRIIHDADGGADRFEGGDGFDVAVVDAVFEEGVDLRLQSRDGGVIVREQNNEAGFSLVALKTERLEVNLGDGDDFVAGGQLGNGKVGLVVIDGGGGDDELRGGRSRDELIGGAGDDVYRGDDGADVFVFGRGDDVVEDFADGVDLLRTETGVGFEALTITQDGEDALIALADGATLRLLNVDVDDVSQADFVL